MKCIANRKANTSLLRKAVERVGREYESLSVEDLNERDESMGSVECDGLVVQYSAFSYDHDPASSTIFFCIDIHSKLRVWPPGRYPSWQFAMRTDGTVERT
jgi:hypothetical protein